MNLADLIAKPIDRAVYKQGYADTYPNVKIGGQSVTAFWLDGVYAHLGEPVWCLVLTFKDAPPTYVVSGTFTGRQPREGTVATAPGGPTITVTPAGGGTPFTATYLSNSYTPAVNDTVRLLWQGSDCTALGKASATPAPATPPAPTAPPPPPVTTGQLNAPATDSATWTNNWGWNAGAGHDLYQGDGTVWGGASVNNGAWFYGGITRQLAGATITRVQFRIPARLNAGATSSAISIHLYTHAMDNRPPGDVTRTTGPGDITISAPYFGGWVDLDPGTWGVTLAGGGGMGISGNPYAGFAGIGRDAASGQLLIDWKR